MSIRMIGIDHSRAEVKIREKFSFTASQAARALDEIKKQPGISGCVLLSTCNRMELYVSSKEEKMDLINLMKLLCCLKQIPENTEQFRSYFTDRKGEAAVRHLFCLTAGMKSRIIGEDQILTQVKEALIKSREQYCTDTVLEVLFRYAVTAGKEVRTKIPPVHADYSAAHHAIAKLKQQGYCLEGKTCLVIGNGQMGRITAQALQAEGASVTVTVRQYRSGMVEIPKGCSRVDYGERYTVLPACDLIVSATVSPNLTIRKEDLVQARGSACREQIYIDLAVPRDMEEEICKIEGVTLYDIDAFCSDRTSEEFERRRKQADQIVTQKMAEFQDWYACRDLVPRIQQVGLLTAEDIWWRMGRGIGQFSQSEQDVIGDLVKESAKKAVDRLLFALRDGLTGEELRHCMDALEKIQ